VLKHRSAPSGSTIMILPGFPFCDVLQDEVPFDGFCQDKIAINFFVYLFYYTYLMYKYFSKIAVKCKLWAILGFNAGTYCDECGGILSGG